MFGFSLVGLDVKDAGVDQLVEPEGGPIVARSMCYGMLAASFNVPDETQFKELNDGTYRERFAEACEELPFKLDIEIEALPEDWSADDFHSEYLNLFDVGAGGPPCPLYGGVWGGDRMQVMEEVMRFYNYFGLKSSEERRIPPDHLSTELEFMHYLTYREAAAPMPNLAVPYRRAQIDFIDRQPGRWLPRLSEKLNQLEPAPYFTSLIALTTQMLERDRKHLDEAEAPA